MTGHGVSLHQRPDGADVPQSLVEGEQLGGKVQRSEAAPGAPQPALLFVRERRNRDPQQGVGLHGGTQERVGILDETLRKRTRLGLQHTANRPHEALDNQ